MRILIVEDDGRMAELLRRGLTGQSHAVDVATDVPEMGKLFVSVRGEPNAEVRVYETR